MGHNLYIIHFIYQRFVFIFLPVSTIFTIYDHFINFLNGFPEKDISLLLITIYVIYNTQNENVVGMVHLNEFCSKFFKLYQLWIKSQNLPFLTIVILEHYMITSLFWFLTFAILLAFCRRYYAGKPIWHFSFFLCDHDLLCINIYFDLIVFIQILGHVIQVKVVSMMIMVLKFLHHSHWFFTLVYLFVMH